MQRRTFLKVSAVAAAALVGRLAFPWAAAAAAGDVSYGGALYRTGDAGFVLGTGKLWVKVPPSMRRWKLSELAPGESTLANRA